MPTIEPVLPGTGVNFSLFSICFPHILFPASHEKITKSNQALRFGEACGKVENRANVGARGAAGLLATLEAQIEELEATIKAKERWENVEVRVVVHIFRAQ